MLFLLHGLLHWLSLLLNLLLGRLLHGLACRRSCRSLLAFLRLHHRIGPNRRFGQESQLPAYQVGHIDTYHRVDEWAGIVIGIENERIPILNSHLEDDIVEFLLHFLHQVLFGLFQCLLRLHPEGYSILHQRLQFGLPLLHDGLGKVLLPLQEINEFLLKLLFPACCLSIILGLQLCHALLGLCVLWHLCHDSLVTHVAELHLCL